MFTCPQPPESGMMMTSRFLTLILALTLAGCAATAAHRLADNLSDAMLNQDDPDTVRAGAPAYLLLLDSLIADSPDDTKLLIAGARLYGAYAGALVSDPIRARRLSVRSRDYARRALCVTEPAVCENEAAPFEQFASAVDGVDTSHIEPMYVLGISWAGWIRAHMEDWNAVAQLPRVDYLLQRVVDLQPDYDRGRAQLYLGVLRSQIPPALGGQPEAGRLHFERAIAFSNGRDLIVKVEFARYYARLMFDQLLHDRLLHEVLEAPAREPGLTLSNTIAKQQAEMLLSDDYF